MLDLDANPSLRLLFLVARRRVVLGFLVAAAAFGLARPSWGSLAAGVPIAVAGAALRLWAAGHLVKGRELTTSGPYRLTRHPLYLGSAGLAVGFAVAARSPVGAGLVLGYLAVMIAAAIRLEEATLRDAFGEAHARYVAGTSPPAARRFAWPRVRANGEPKALAGVAASVGVLVVLAWLRAG